MTCREVVRVAEQAGIALADRDIDSCLAIIDRLSPDKKTSMLQDIEAHRKTEVEIFGGSVMALGRRYGVPTPVNEMLFKLISTIEQTYPGA
jgi:2-dehydropantoate 2-reductase